MDNNFKNIQVNYNNSIDYKISQLYDKVVEKTMHLSQYDIDSILNEILCIRK